MAISITPLVEDALDYILEAADSTRGAETIPIHISVNEKDNAPDDSTKSVLFKAKIHVSKNKRSQVKNELIEYLNKLLDKESSLPFNEIIPGTKSKPDADQFDVVIKYIGSKPQVIRILIKPVGGGSGGGAAKTKIQEVGQAVYLAMRYNKGKDLECHPTSSKKCLSDDDYTEAMKDVDGPGVTIQEIQGLEQKWHDAFILGANKIANEVKGKGWKFVRGDNEVEEAISNAFNRCKKSKGAPQNEDKWNPSDIWMVKNKTKIVQELDKENTIDCLNNFMNQAFSKKAIKNKSGKDVAPRSLIGISLKKLGPTARWEVMNPPNVKYLEKAGKVTFQKTQTLNELTAFSAMDVYFVYLPTGNKRQGSFQARNFGGDKKGQWQFELKGEFAAQGKIKGDVMRKLLTQAEVPGYTKIPREPNFNDCKPESTQKTKITNEIYKLMNALPTTPKDWTGTAADKKEAIRSKDASWRFSKLAGLRFLDWLMSAGVDSDRALKEMYLYASSQTDKSSVFYKVY